jgi:hypothetical protein
VAPTVVITSIAFAGAVGSTTAIPSCYFTPSGTVTSITYTLYGDTSPTPTTVVSTGPVTPSATFYQYLGATVNGYYYKYTIAVANAAGSNSATSSVLENAAPWTPTSPSAPLACWFDGTRGVATNTWTNYGTSSNFKTNMTTVVSNPFVPVLVNGLQAVRVVGNVLANAGTWSYTYSSLPRSIFIVYKQTVTYTIATNLFITDSASNGLNFNYNNSTFSTPNYQTPRLQMKGPIVTLASSSTQYTDPNINTNQTAFPFTVGMFASATTLANNRITVNYLNAPLSSTLLATSQLRPNETFALQSNSATPFICCELLMYDGELLPTDIANITNYLNARWGIPPSVTITGTTFAGAVGSDDALPTCTFTHSPVTSLTYTLYGDTSLTPTTVVSSGSLATSATSFQYSGATVPNFNYKFTITGSTSVGSSSLSSSVLSNTVWTPITPTAKLASWFDGTRGVSSLTWTNYGNGTGGNMTPTDIAIPFTTTTVNGKQAVLFPTFATGSWSVLYALPSSTAARSYFIVYKPTTVAFGLNGGLSLKTTDATTTGLLGTLTANSTPPVLNTSSTENPDPSANVFYVRYVGVSSTTFNQTANPSLWGVNASAADISLNRCYMNRSMTPLQVATLTPPALASSVIYTAPQSSVEIAVCELLMYDGELTAADLINIAQYLTSRWGITVP